MKWGVVFPQPEIGHDLAAVRDFVQAAEDLGYDYLVTYDLVMVTDPASLDLFHDPFVLLGYIAALTSKIELSTGIMVLPSRQTALVAKQAASLDVLSGGRLRLGFAVGWNPGEYQAMGTDFQARGKRIEEQAVLLRKLWTEEIVDFQGEYHKVEGLGLRTLPVQRPIPIWFGGWADPVLKRIARLGDGWCADKISFEGAKNRVEKLTQFMESEGRAIEDIEMSFSTTLVDPRKWPDEAVPVDWGQFVSERRELGATHIDLSTTFFGSSKNPQDHIDQIRQFKETVE